MQVLKYLVITSTITTTKHECVFATEEFVMNVLAWPRSFIVQCGMENDFRTKELNSSREVSIIRLLFGNCPL